MSMYIERERERKRENDRERERERERERYYGQFSKFHVCLCGLDPGNLKFETVRTHKQHICF